MNSKIKLVCPSISYEKQIWDYKLDFHQRKESLAGCGSLERVKSIDEWFNDVKNYEFEETCPIGFVPSTILLAIREDDQKLVGIIDFRHHIDHPTLSVWGGHIGYSVLHEERRKGYATEMLRLILLECRKSGLEKVLITCNHHNIGSRKTILANGGVFEKNIEVDDTIIDRYWITLS